MNPALTEPMRGPWMRWESAMSFATYLARRTGRRQRVVKDLQTEWHVLEVGA